MSWCDHSDIVRSHRTHIRFIYRSTVGDPVSKLPAANICECCEIFPAFFNATGEEMESRNQLNIKQRRTGASNIVVFMSGPSPCDRRCCYGRRYRRQPPEGCHHHRSLRRTSYTSSDKSICTPASLRSKRSISSACLLAFTFAAASRSDSSMASRSALAFFCRRRRTSDSTIVKERRRMG